MQQAPGTPLAFEHAENFRELGGWPAAEGKTVKHGLFWRSGALCYIQTPAEREKFEQLGIRVICDLRSSQERSIQPDPDFPGIRRSDISAIRNPDGSEVNFDPHAFLKRSLDELMGMGQEMHTVYTNLPFGNQAYKAMFDAIMADELPILFHCSAGKDRTGVAAALILLALGASEETILQDFAMTNQCCPKAKQEYLNAYAEVLQQHPQLKPILQTMSGVQVSSMQATLQAIRDRYPTTEAYFEAEYGITAADLKQLQNRCLE